MTVQGRNPNYPRLRKLAHFIRDFTRENHYPPSVAEMGRHMGNGKPFSNSLVVFYLRDLRDREIIDFIDGMNRTVHVLDGVNIDKVLPEYNPPE